MTKVELSDFSNAAANFIKQVNQKDIDQLTIVINNDPKAVIISADEYKNLLNMSQEYLENLELQQTVQEREKTPSDQMLSENEMKDFFKSKGCSV